jgi:aromatic-L-amino-acid/L-tryptophan decarboxylase
MDCSLLSTSRTQDFRRAFSLVPEYLRTSESADSLSDYGLALGRRFQALRLWPVLRRDGSGEENEEILEPVNRSGELFRSGELLSSETRLDGRYVLRLAIGSDRTTVEDIRLAWEPASGPIENMICTMYA